MKKLSERANNQWLNFQKALKKLEEFSALPVQNERDQAGIIQAFEFTFEQCWKFFQKRGEDQGEQVPGPKPALEVALKYGWISLNDENHWLSMLKDRNLTSHLYRGEVSKEVFKRVTENYISLFKKI